MRMPADLTVCRAIRLLVPLTRVYGDEAPPARRSRPTTPPAHRRALAARWPHPGGPARGAAPGLVEPLSDRELTVLELLAAGRSNRQTVDELVVALDIVKKHVGRLLDKLAAGNRTQAVTRVRDRADPVTGRWPTPAATRPIHRRAGQAR